MFPDCRKCLFVHSVYFSAEKKAWCRGKIIFENRQNSPDLETQIDQMVYEWYGLTAEEIQVVEGE